jgi:hypothetical protein
MHGARHPNQDDPDPIWQGLVLFLLVALLVAVATLCAATL